MCGEPTANNTLQVTFDPLPTFAVAKAVIASNAPERWRYATQGRSYAGVGNRHIVAGLGE